MKKKWPKLLCSDHYGESYTVNIPFFCLLSNLRILVSLSPGPVTQQHFMIILSYIKEV